MTQIQVTKRNGNKELLDIEKMHKVVMWATEGITGVSASEVEIKSHIQFYNGIKTADIQETLIKSAADLISEETPNYQYVAGRLINYHLRKQVYGDYRPWPLIDLVRKNAAAGFYDAGLLAAYSDEEWGKLNSFVHHDRDEHFTYVAMEQWRGKYLVQNRVTGETGEPWTEDMAEDLIKQFDENYEVFSEWRKELIATYEDQGYLMLPDGWTMFGDNEKFRSVGNMPVQGLGACVLRKAVSLAQDAGLTVLFTLHDAIYIEYDYGDLGAIDTLKRCMDEAFVSFFEGELKELAKCVRVDPQTWGIGYDKPIIKDGDVIYQTVTTPGGMKVAASEYFVDPRAAREFDKFSKYMLESSGEDLLA